MPKTDERPGPLAIGWEALQSKLREKKHVNEVDIQMARLMFYFGAKVGVANATRGEMAIAIMLSELRDFDRFAQEQKEEIERDTCPAVSIS